MSVYVPLTVSQIVHWYRGVPGRSPFTSLYSSPAAVSTTSTVAVPVIVALENVGAVAGAASTAAVAELVTGSPGDVPVNATGVTLTLINFAKSVLTGV